MAAKIWANGLVVLVAAGLMAGAPLALSKK